MPAEAVLAHPSPADLAATVEGNLWALFRAMATSLDGDLVEGERLSRHLAFPSNPMFKGVWRTRLTADEADAAIDETLAWFAEREAPFLFWWTGPATTPADLGERLVARGFIPFEQDAPGMAADLDTMNEAALTQVPAGFAVEEVRDEAALAAFKRTLVAGLEVPEWAARAWVDATRRIGIGRTPWRMYVGWLGGEPVATTMLFTGAGVASVYGVATVPAQRGRGIGGAITLAPLLQARAEGFHHAVLFSSAMGVGAYRRIGFRDCGIRINRYLWRRG